MIKLAALNLKKLKNNVDWQLLLFIILFMNVKLAIKILAIVLIYILQFNFKFDFRLKNTRLPIFYLLVIGIAVFNLIIYRDFLTLKYNLVFLSGIGFWVMCLLAMHQLKLAVERNSIETLHRTIFIFFLINASISIVNLAVIIWETKSFNPYLYQGMYQKYFISTGDYIKGVTFDVSITNSVLNALGVIYFLFRKNSAMLLLCMAILLLTGSNMLNIITAGMLLIMFIWYSNRDQKSLIVVCLMLLIIFMTKVSPQNSNYLLHTSAVLLHKDTITTSPPANKQILLIQVPDNQLSNEEWRQKIALRYLDSQYHAIQRTNTAKQIAPVRKKLIIPLPNVNARPYQEAFDTTAIQHTLLSFIKKHSTELPLSGQNHNPGLLPGKVISLLQSIFFLWHHPQKILTGNGIGKFSSKIAFKATNLGVTGGYPANYAYVNKDFMANHLDVYLRFFSGKAGLHSVINNPNAVYNQLLGEYGLAGILAFVFFYLGYFLKHYRYLTYGIPVLLFTLSIFFLEYWFEQLSVMILIELILLVNMKETEIKTKPNDAH